jgi:hypothetical protein
MGRRGRSARFLDIRGLGFVLYLNGGGGRDWKRQVIASTGSHDIVTADLDGDGRPDILGANHGGPFQLVELWLNRQAAP